jgi:hypothetical protein
MNLTRTFIPGTLMLVLLALATILLAPVTAFSHGMPDSAKMASLAVEDGCHDNADGHQDDCCETTACACACHAPLAGGIVLTLPVMDTPAFSASTDLSFPQVYLPIFVPPQNCAWV